VTRTPGAHSHHVPARFDLKCRGEALVREVTALREAADSLLDVLQDKR